MNLSRNPIPAEPLDALRAAMLKCPVPVVGGDHHVELHHNWCLPWDQPKQVSVVGAFLMVVQPDPDDDDRAAAPDPTGCAAAALGCPTLWLEGVNDGFAGEPDTNRLAQFPLADPRGQQYRDGVAWGQKLKAE